MAVTTRSSPSLTLLFLFLLLATPPPSQSLPYSQYQTIFSLAHSLMTRVANLRAARGDISGANRARFMAEMLERGQGLGFRGYVWWERWNYAKNYAWRDLSYTELSGAVSDTNELLSWLGELSGAGSDAARAARVGRVSSSLALLRKLIKVFRQSVMLRELVETVQREVVDGGLLRDCLELGSNDLKASTKKLERGLGLGFWGCVGSAGWDYAKKYAWRDLSYTEMYGAISDANELLSWLGELRGAASDAARAALVDRNYQNVGRVSNSLLGELLKVFPQSGMLMELVETVQIEVVEGAFFRDCLELGSNDLKGFIQILKDLGLQYFPHPASPNAKPNYAKPEL